MSLHDFRLGTTYPQELQPENNTRKSHNSGYPFIPDPNYSYSDSSFDQNNYSQIVGSHQNHITEQSYSNLPIYHQPEPFNFDDRYDLQSNSGLYGSSIGYESLKDEFSHLNLTSSNEEESSIDKLDPSITTEMVIIHDVLFFILYSSNS